MLEYAGLGGTRGRGNGGRETDDEKEPGMSGGAQEGGCRELVLIWALGGLQRKTLLDVDGMVSA